MAHFLVKDCKSVDSLGIQEERFAFPVRSVIWQYIDTQSHIVDVLSTDVYRVVRTGCNMVRKLKCTGSVRHSDDLSRH